MIPYQELCDALDRWRIQNGLPVSSTRGAGAKTPSPPPPPGPFAPVPVDAMEVDDSAVMEADELVEEVDAAAVVDDSAIPEPIDAGEAASGGNEYPDEATVVSGALDDGGEYEDMATDIHEAGAPDVDSERPSRGESTSEIDIDSAEIVEDKD